MEETKQKSVQKHTPCYAEEALARIEILVNRMNEALIGNEFNKNNGLVSNVEKNTKDIETLFDTKVEQTAFIDVQKKVERINLKITYAIGGGIVVIWFLENYILK